MPPKVATKPDRANGVLPFPAAARAHPAKSSTTARLKLEIRRLPPGLTLTEFEEILGEEWKLGNGKIDWREYRPGKVKAPGKLPEQSRCYIHVVNEAAVKEFEQKFLSSAFVDKAGTCKSAELNHLPPTLGFAPNQRTPLQVKQRQDGRQGTIDQDPEFIAFLESETMPITKPSTAAEGLKAAEKEKDGGDEAKVTPLIADLREKKAAKAKAAAEKAEKKKAAEEGKKGKDAGASAAGDKDGRGGAGQQQQKVQQAAQQAAKAMNKQTAAKQQQQHGEPTSQKTAASPAKAKKVPQSPKQQNVVPAAPTSPAPDRRPPGQRQRGNAEGIKKMLQKDLGIRPKATASQTKATQPATAATSLPTSTPAAPSAAATAPKPTATPANPAPKPSPSPASASNKAYLKHANPSQGMTEMLILRALANYGEVSNVTIDPRKGTAIAVFKDQEGLKKAIEAKRVPVAGGAVEVLEFRDGGRGGGGGGGGVGGAGGGRGGRGGFRGGRGGGRGAAAQAGPHSPKPAVSAPAAPAAPAANASGG